jgi:hypothetical protein
MHALYDRRQKTPKLYLVLLTYFRNHNVHELWSTLKLLCEINMRRRRIIDPIIVPDKFACAANQWATYGGKYTMRD